MKEKGSPFSDYQHFSASGNITRDTAFDPQRPRLNAVNSLEESRALVTNTFPTEKSIFTTNKDFVQLTYHMRNLLQDFYVDILDDPQEKKPELIQRSIPRKQMRGTKDANEFRNKKLKKANRDLAAYQRHFGDPARYFEEYPPLVCDLTDEYGNETYALLRGHHEARRAGVYKIDQINCRVITPELLAAALNAYETSEHFGQITPKLVRDFLQAQIDVSVDSFKTIRATKHLISKPNY